MTPSENPQKEDHNSQLYELIVIGVLLVVGFIGGLIAVRGSMSSISALFCAVLAGLLLACGGDLLIAIRDLAFLVTTNYKAVQARILQICILTFILITALTILTSNDMTPRGIATGFLVGLVGTVVTVVGIQVYLLSDRVGSVGGSVEEAHDEIKRAHEEIENAVKTFQKDQMGSMSSAIKALEKVLEIKQEIANDKLLSKADALHPGLEALGLSYSAWISRLQSKDKYVGRVWQAAFPTFYREEAFDIRHGEIVTNGRNFCYLLLATLSQLLEEHSGKTVVYYQVTPVHPKDWYNWPHGFGEHHCYFENEFIGVYHRSLRALIELAKNKTLKDKSPLLEHGRFILRSDDAAPEINRFGWNLPIKTEFDSAEEFWILDIPIVLTGAVDNTLSLCDPCKKLISYYTEHLHAANAQLHFPSKKDHYAVPAFNKAWESSNSLKSVKAIVKALVASGGTSIPCSRCVGTLKAAAETHLDSKITSAISNIGTVVLSLTDSQPRLAAAWEHVTSVAKTWNTDDFPRFLQNYHLASVLLSSFRGVDKDIRGLLPNVLRKRSAMECTGWTNLYTTFAGMCQ